MKKLIFLFLATALLLTVTACGGGAEPAEPAAPAQTTPVATEPVPVPAETAAPVVDSTEAPTEEPNVYTVYELKENETYVDAIRHMGFPEVDMEVCVQDAAEKGRSGAQATPLSMEVGKDSFHMEVDYSGYDFMANNVVSYGTVELLGIKAEGLADISGIDPKDYQYTGSSTYTDSNGVSSDFGSFADGYLLSDMYWYYNLDEKGEQRDVVYVAAYYYKSTSNLYNVIYRVPAGVLDLTEPSLLTRVNSQFPYSPFYPQVETLTYGDFTFELSQFAIQCGDERFVYSFRPGMSFSDWACSELNTDGWIPWYGDEVLSPDRKYCCNTGYLDMQETMEFYGCGNLLIAEEYDGNTNYLNNDGTTVEISSIDLGGLDMSNISGATIMSGDALKEYMEQNGLTSIDQIADHMNQNGTGNIPTGQITPENAADGISMEDIINAGASEENEIAERGNISIPVAHMVNARTPLFTPGFRIVSKEGGYSAYHSVEIAYDLLLDDILYVYMNGIAQELIPHIKLYAFPESDAFLNHLGDHTILNAHPTPFEQGNEMLTIPENAVCLTFERVPDGQEAPNSPNPRKPGHENLNKDAVFTSYVTKDDPQFGKGVNMVFAVTFDDELVYWIHLGANFNESNNTQWASNKMPY